MQGGGEGVIPLVLTPSPWRLWAVCLLAQSCQNERVVLGERAVWRAAMRLQLLGVGTGRGQGLWVACLFCPLQLHATSRF